LVGHWGQPAPILRGEALTLGAISDVLANMQTAFVCRHRRCSAGSRLPGSAAQSSTPRLEPDPHFRP